MSRNMRHIQQILAKRRASLTRRTSVTLGVERLSGTNGNKLRCIQLSAHGRSYQIDWCKETEADEQVPADTLRRVVTALNEHHCISKMVEAPAFSFQLGNVPPGNVQHDSAIDDFISERLEQLMPFPLKDVYYDYELEQVEGHQARVLVTAARRAAVQDHLSLLSLANLQPQIIDTESQALTRAVNYLLPYQSPHLAAVSTVSGEPLLVLNITSDTTLLLIIQRQCSVFSRSLPMGLQTNTDELLQQVQRTLQLFYQGQQHKLAGAILTGSAAAQLNPAALRDTLQLPATSEVLVLNPLLQFSQSSSAQASWEEGSESALTVAVGLALRGFHAWHT